MQWWLIAVPPLLIGLFSTGLWLNPRLLLNAFPLTMAAGVRVRRRAFMVLWLLSLAAMQLALVAYLVKWGNIVGQP